MPLPLQLHLHLLARPAPCRSTTLVVLPSTMVLWMLALQALMTGDQTLSGKLVCIKTSTVLTLLNPHLRDTLRQLPALVLRSRPSTSRRLRHLRKPHRTPTPRSKRAIITLVSAIVVRDGMAVLLPEASRSTLLNVRLLKSPGPAMVYLHPRLPKAPRRTLQSSTPMAWSFGLLEAL